jgi:hypothetical protein
MLRYASNDLANYATLTGGSYMEALDHFRRQHGRSNLELPRDLLNMKKK